MEFKFTEGNLVLRSCNKSLTLKGKHTTAEICLKHKGSLSTIAYYAKDSDNDFSLHFVYDRPFDLAVNSGKFMHMARLGNKLLKADGLTD